MNSQQARALSIRYTYTPGEKRKLSTRDVLDNVESICKRGGTHLLLEGLLDELVISKLKNYGYSIEESIRENFEKFTTVKW